MANKSLMRAVALTGCLGVAPLSPAVGQSCMLCAPTKQSTAAATQQPIQIQIETGIDFSKIGLVRLGQGGTAVIDPTSGQRTLSGSLVDLGGLPIRGTVTIRGDRNGNLSVTFPSRVQLTNASGATCALANFTTTLKPNPKLDSTGVLSFTFGGTLQISGTATGTFRGSIPITVDYR